MERRYRVAIAGCHRMLDRTPAGHNWAAGFAADPPGGAGRGLRPGRRHPPRLRRLLGAAARLRRLRGDARRGAPGRRLHRHAPDAARRADRAGRRRGGAGHPLREAARHLARRGRPHRGRLRPPRRGLRVRARPPLVPDLPRARAAAARRGDRRGARRGRLGSAQPGQPRLPLVRSRARPPGKRGAFRSRSSRTRGTRLRGPGVARRAGPGRANPGEGRLHSGPWFTGTLVAIDSLSLVCPDDPLRWPPIDPRDPSFVQDRAVLTTVIREEGRGRCCAGGPNRNDARL